MSTLGKLKHDWVVLKTRDVLAMGCKIHAWHNHNNTRKYNTLELHPTMLPSRNHYTYEERVKMNELLMFGAVWCEYGRKHFLATLPPSIRRKINGSAA